MADDRPGGLSHNAGCYTPGMAQYRSIERGAPKRGRRGALVTLIVLAIVILLGARSLASFSIEYQWWKELGQIDTWLAMLAYGFAPLLAATLIAFGVLWVAHARALKFAGTGLSEHPLYAWISSAGLLFARISHRGRIHRDLDRRALPRGAWHSGRSQCVARFRLRFAAQVLSVRFAVLLRSARLFTGAGDCQRAGLLDRGARLATSPQAARIERSAADRSVLLPAGRRPGKPVPARRAGGLSAGAVAAILPGALRNGL